MAADIDDDVQVGRYRVPAAELSWSYSPTGGPGGQHANRSHTRVELRYDLGSSSVFPPADRRHLLERLGSRVVDGVVIVVADESRSQFRNRALARRRLADWLAEALVRPEPRRPTRPSRSAKRRRVADKRARSEVKRLRRRPEPD